ncbi:IS91 family transposase [Granulosicoccus antarcticus]|uniref:IS91 family transposase n=1 Tax=Granulosicoccus antarcticus TaxID=437505 RepID=UPI0012FD06AC|nr:transposase [Granulosicoccus antarcticus]
MHYASRPIKGELHRIKHPGEIDQRLDELMKPDWVVFSKPCPTHAGSVIDYLGRYSHRIAISDQRIVSVDNDQVRFQYKDYAGGGERKTMALDAMEFIRRYLLHVLPKGLMRIRHYGLLANRCRRKKIKLVREALNATNDPVKGQEKPSTTSSKDTVVVCPRCRKGHLHFSTLSSHSRSTEGITMH